MNRTFILYWSRRNRNLPVKKPKCKTIFASLVVTEGSVESLPLTSVGDFVRGRNSVFEPREGDREASPSGERQALC